MLSAAEKESLRARYDVFGLDAVREEVERNERGGLASYEENAFARSWIASEEAKIQRTIYALKFTAVIIFSVLGGTIAWFLVQ